MFSSLNPASGMSVFIPAPDGPSPLPIPPSTPLGVAEYGVVGVVEDGVVVEGVVVDGVVVEGVVVDGFVVTGVGVAVTGVGVVLVPAALEKRRWSGGRKIIFEHITKNNPQS